MKGLLIVKYNNLKDSSERPIFVKSTFDPKDEKQQGEATNYGVLLSRLALHSRDLVRDLDPSNDLTFLRVSCKKHEMMIAPDKNYFLIVIQEPDKEKEAPTPAKVTEAAEQAAK